jgi:hypothetical protein
MRSPATHASMALLALFAGGCGDSGAPSGGAQLSLNLATAPASTAASAAAVGTKETFTDGTNTLVLTKVELALREIELHRAGAADCGDGAGDDCEELELGPVLVDLPLGTGAARHVSVAIAPGTYDKVEFKIRAPSNGGGSIRVTGTYNGKDFVYTGNLDAGLELELNPPLVASDPGATDVTLFVDLSTWFRDSAAALIDPASANPGEPNEAAVSLRIKQSLHAFEDDDRDGRDDHGRGGGLDDGPGHQ